MSHRQVPTYSIDEFRRSPRGPEPFQVEPFDADRHFSVVYPHRHDFYELLLLTKGSGEHSIDEYTYPIAPPCLFFLYPGQIHTIHTSEDIGGYIFLFTAEFFTLGTGQPDRLVELPFFYPLTSENPPLQLSPADLEVFQTVFRWASEECAADRPERTTILRNQLELLLREAERRYPVSASDPGHGAGRILAKRFKQLVEERYRDHWEVQQFADALSVTANHLTQTVKGLTGEPPSAHIRAKLILETKRLLRQTDWNVAQIAEHLGLADGSQLNRHFRAATGQSLSAWRSESKKSSDFPKS